MKKTLLIFAIGAMGLTVVNAQQQTRQTQEQQRTQTEQVQNRVQLEGASRIQNTDLPRNIRTTIDANREDKDAQIMSIQRGTRDGQENFDIIFNRDNRTWTRTYGADGKEIQMDDNRRREGTQTGTQRQGQTQTGGTTGGQTRTGTTQTQTGGTTGGQTQTGGTTGGQTRTGTGTTGGQTQMGGATGTQTQTGGTTGTRTQTGGTTGTRTQTGGTTGTQTQAGQATQRATLEGARRMEARDMPTNIQNTIDQNAEDRGAEITTIQRGTRDGQDNYDITFRKENRTWIRTYDKDGKMIPDRRDDR
ncbi:MAG TPA: hypothetical protein VK921_03545 [Anditalea sp.]|nr:hypothetical protein [Anditalea sp.]